MSAAVEHLVLQGLLTRAALRAHLGFVTQEPVLFGLTVKENLLLAKPSASEAELWTALKQAKADDKVAELKSFYPSLPSGQEVVGYAADLADTPNLEANMKQVLDKATENGQKKLDHIVFCAGDLFTLPTLQNVEPETALKGFTMRWLSGVMIGKLVATGSYMHVSTSSSICRCC